MAQQNRAVADLSSMDELEFEVDDGQSKRQALIEALSDEVAVDDLVEDVETYDVSVSFGGWRTTAEGVNEAEAERAVRRNEEQRFKRALEQLDAGNQQARDILRDLRDSISINVKGTKPGGAEIDRHGEHK